MRFKMIALGLTVAILGGVILTGCAGEEPAEPTDQQQEIWGDVPEETQGIAADNPYMTFYYPQQWEGRVEEIRTQEGENTVHSFVTTVTDREVTLFSVVIGPEEAADGYLLGQLETDGGAVNVYTVISELPADGWTETTYGELCALQEQVNDIIMQFHQDSRFTPSK